MFGGDLSENLMIIKGIDILEQAVVLERLPGFWKGISLDGGEGVTGR